MKIRIGFVSNSSSSSYLVTNLTDHIVDLVQFVNENQDVINDWNVRYGDFESKYKLNDLVKTAENRNIRWEPNESKVIEFGDHDGEYAYTSIGMVYDYCLRNGGQSKSFKWKLLHQNR